MHGGWSFRWGIPALVIGLFALAGCGDPPAETGFQNAAALPMILVEAARETPPVRFTEDAADDPAAWLHPERMEESIILGTDKKNGLFLYDVEGNEKVFFNLGDVNNVDVRQGIYVEGRRRDVGAASLRRTPDIIVFEMSPLNGAIIGHSLVNTAQLDPYGICVGNFADQLLIFVTYKSGAVRTFRLTDGLPEMKAVFMGRRDLGGELEGCVFDDETGRLFVGEEEAGIHVLSVGETGVPTGPKWVDQVGDESPLVTDVEGLTLMRSNGTTYLIASSQGNDTFIIYESEPPYKRLAILKIIANTKDDIDEVTHTDGIHAISEAVSESFPCGMLIVQDDDNGDLPQNFKYVDWCPVAEKLRALH